MVEILWLHLFLVCLPVIEVVEVGNNDRHRERDRQHAGNGTQGPYYFSPHTYWPVCFQKIIESILVWRENSGNNNNKRTFIKGGKSQKLTSKICLFKIRKPSSGPKEKYTKVSLSWGISRPLFLPFTLKPARARVPKRLLKAKKPHRSVLKVRVNMLHTKAPWCPMGLEPL